MSVEGSGEERRAAPTSIEEFVAEAIAELRKTKPGSKASLEAITTINQFYVGLKHSSDPEDRGAYEALLGTLAESGIIERHADTNTDAQALLRDIERLGL